MTKAGATADKSIAQITNAWQKSQASTDPVYAATLKRNQEVEKAYQTAAKAVEYLGVSHAAAAKQVADVANKYDAIITKAKAGADAQTVFGKAMSPVNAQLVALSAGAGPVGTFLSA